MSNAAASMPLPAKEVRKKGRMCRTCKGSGRIYHGSNPFIGQEAYETNCPRCGGTGRVGT